MPEIEDFCEKVGCGCLEPLPDNRLHYHWASETFDRPSGGWAVGTLTTKVNYPASDVLLTAMPVAAYNKAVGGAVVQQIGYENVWFGPSDGSGWPEGESPHALLSFDVDATVVSDNPDWIELNAYAYCVVKSELADNPENFSL